MSELKREGQVSSGDLDGISGPRDYSKSLPSARNSRNTMGVRILTCSEYNGTDPFGFPMVFSFPMVDKMAAFLFCFPMVR